MSMVMARPLRIEFADAIYHVTNRGNGRGAIVSDDRDRERWMRDRGSGGGSLSVAGVLFCPDGQSLSSFFLQTPEPNLSRGMQEINGSYAAYFNLSGTVGRASLPGPLQGGGGGGPRPLGRPEPVRASEPGTGGVGPAAGGMVLEQLSRLSARKRGVRWVVWAGARGVRRGHGRGTATVRGVRRGRAERGIAFPPFGAAHGLILGSGQFVERIQRCSPAVRPVPNFPSWPELRNRPDLAQVVRVVQDHYQIDPSRWKPGRRVDDLRGRSPPISPAK